MKVNRTYSMDYDLVTKLAKKHNQSKVVCNAVRQWLDEESQFDLRNVDTRRLMAALYSRDDIPKMIKAGIEAWLAES